LWFAPAIAIHRRRAEYNLKLFVFHQFFFWGRLMKFSLDRKSLLCLAVAFFLCATVPAAFTQQNPNLDKHARRIEKKLTKFRPGSFVEIDLRDNSTSLGKLGSLSESTFQVVDSDTNKPATFAYSDVAGVHKGTEYIGEGSEPGHHFHLSLPVLIATGAVAAGAATYLAIR
jgi:hypothetical protein